MRPAAAAAAATATRLSCRARAAVYLEALRVYASGQIMSQITKHAGASAGSSDIDRRPQAALDFGQAWEYAPAPEATDHVHIDPKYGLFIGGRWVTPRSGKYFHDDQPEHRAGARRGRRGERAGRRRRREGGARGLRQVLVEDARAPIARSTSSASPARSRRRRASSRSSRRWTAASRSRSRATSTSRSRRRTSSITPAGPTSSTTRSRAGSPRPLGVAGQIIPWNFPLLMAAWKLAPALACGNTVRPQARRDDAAHGAPPREDHRGGGAAAGRRQHRHRRGRDRRRARRTTRTSNKVAFTGSTDVGKRIQRAIAGTTKRLTLELGGKAANIVFADAPARSGGRGDRQRHLLQPGARLLRRLAPPRRGERARSRRPQAARPHGTRCASAIRSTRTPTSARSTRRCSSRRSASSSRPARRRAPTRFSAPCTHPGEGLLVRADVLHRRRAVAPHRARGDLRAGAHDHDVPHAGRGDREGEQHDVRPLGRRSGPTRARRSSTSRRS